ncbi:MAG: hypothetical protein JNM56_25025 [Planctomycetia bacterium]|jgi:hypothetical protein|nr:hypothetical protein [Planctomycetia bacterium]
MDVGLLKKLFGAEQQWYGACTVIIDGEVTVQAVGTDAIGVGGAKFYAPRTISGRIAAEAVCLLKDGSAVVVLQQQRTKSATGEEILKQTLTITAPEHVVAVEFTEAAPVILQGLGVGMPAFKVQSNQSGLLVRPKPGVP